MQIRRLGLGLALGALLSACALQTGTEDDVSDVAAPAPEEAESVAVQNFDHAEKPQPPNTTTGGCIVAWTETNCTFLIMDCRERCVDGTFTPWHPCGGCLGFGPFHSGHPTSWIPPKKG